VREVTLCTTLCRGRGELAFSRGVDIFGSGSGAAASDRDPEEGQEQRDREPVFAQPGGLAALRRRIGDIPGKLARYSGRGIYSIQRIEGGIS
jgi:hypothetical protein